jgi:hypothetical protein
MNCIGDAIATTASHSDGDSTGLEFAEFTGQYLPLTSTGPARSRRDSRRRSTVDVLLRLKHRLYVHSLLMFRIVEIRLPCMILITVFSDLVTTR